MKENIKDLGKVLITCNGNWDNKIAYDKLSLVDDEFSQASYISKQNVPIGININNEEYWQKLRGSGYKSNNIIIISNIDDTTGLLKVYTLKEAINSIHESDRRAGAIIGFYGYSNNNTTINEWYLYQFNSGVIDNWTDNQQWVSLYGNVDKFKGWFINEESLNYVASDPSIGDYAFVGNTFDESYIYRCITNRIWSKTDEKATNNVKLTMNSEVIQNIGGNKAIVMSQYATTRAINDFNVSVLHPNGGTNGSGQVGNLYSLQTAIDTLSYIELVHGHNITFLNKDNAGIPITYTFYKGEANNVNNWRIKDEMVIVQNIGNNENIVMSQKAVTTSCNDYNVSFLYPTGGSDIDGNAGGNLYDLDGAAQKLISEGITIVQGQTISFLDRYNRGFPVSYTFYIRNKNGKIVWDKIGVEANRDLDKKINSKLYANYGINLIDPIISDWITIRAEVQYDSTPKGNKYDAIIVGLDIANNVGCVYKEITSGAFQVSAYNTENDDNIKHHIVLGIDNSNILANKVYCIIENKLISYNLDTLEQSEISDYNYTNESIIIVDTNGISIKTGNNIQLIFDTSDLINLKITPCIGFIVDHIVVSHVTITPLFNTIIGNDISDLSINNSELFIEDYTRAIHRQSPIKQCSLNMIVNTNCIHDYDDNIKAYTFEGTTIPDIGLGDIIYANIDNSIKIKHESVIIKEININNNVVIAYKNGKALVLSTLLELWNLSTKEKTEIATDTTVFITSNCTVYLKYTEEGIYISDDDLVYHLIHSRDNILSMGLEYVYGIICNNTSKIQYSYNINRELQLETIGNSNISSPIHITPDNKIVKKYIPTPIMLFGDYTFIDTNNRTSPYAKFNNSIISKLGTNLINITAVNGIEFGGENNSAIININDINTVKPKILVICIGYHDFMNGIPLGEITDTTNNSFSGGIHKFISEIKNTFPKTKILICTPIPCAAQLNPNDIGLMLTHYCRRIREISELYSIPVIDLFAKSNISFFNEVEGKRVYTNNTGNLNHLGIENIILNLGCSLLFVVIGQKLARILF